MNGKYLNLRKKSKIRTRIIDSALFITNWENNFELKENIKKLRENKIVRIKT